MNRIARCPEQKPGKGPNGRPFCRLCQKEVPKGRRAWCSKECIRESSIRTDPGFARSLVFKRDKGVCARCGIDTDLLKAEADRIRDWCFKNLPDSIRGYAPRRTFLVAFGFTRHHLWEMDHILPVSEGGGECGLDNLRTLCIPCHDTVTAQLRGRLAADARRKKTGSVQGSLGLDRTEGNGT